MKLKLRISEKNDSAKVRIVEQGDVAKLEFREVTKVSGAGVGEKYYGEYIVTPKACAQVIPTKNKVLLDDVTIKAIPYVESDNSAGGKTVTIG